MTQKGLLGSTEGWSLEPVASWLFGEGRRVNDPVKLIEGLARQLDLAGARIDRLAFVCRTLHPQFIGWNVRWTRQKGAQRASVEHAVRATDAFIGSPVEYVQQHQRPYRLRVTPRAEEGEPSLLPDLRHDGITDYAALPMPFGREMTNVLTAATADPGGFTDADLERLATLARLVSPFVEIIAVRRTTLGLLDTFVGPRISERIFQGQVKRGDGDRIEAAFWYSDLRGFTALSDRLPAETVVDILNQYFDCQVNAIRQRGGEVLKYMGDGLLAVFPIDEYVGDAQQVCGRVLEAAHESRVSVAELQYPIGDAVEQFRFGVALHVGRILYGNIGGGNRLDFTCIGPAVNLAARLEKIASNLRRTVVASEGFAGICRGGGSDLGEFPVAGFAKAARVYGLVDETPLS